jgi:hypothetical protein
MQSYLAKGYGRLFLLSFLTHGILYLEIQTPDDLCIISSCDNSSLPTNKEASHTRDSDSSSWYTKPDHDVIMTLSALRTSIPLNLASLHVSGYEMMETVNSVFSPDPHNSMSLPTNSLRMYLRISEQLKTI